MNTYFMDKNSATYRMLQKDGDKILLIDTSATKKPVWKNQQEVTKTNIQKLISDTEDELTPRQERIMRQRFTMISGILPLVGNDKKMNAAIKRTAEEYGVCVPTVKKYLFRYLVYNQKAVLAPEEKEERKELTAFEKDIRWGLNRFYYTAAKRSLTDAYTLMIKERYYRDGKLLEERPSFWQFKYYYRKHKSTSNQIITRQGLSSYQRDNRPLLGDGVQQYCPAVGTMMLDSTIMDIYLVNDAGQIVGRPVMTAAVDGFSGLLCGYSLGWEGGNYSLNQLMLNIIKDKVEHCLSFGIQIEKEDWNCQKLAGKFITDKGAEYASDNFSQLTELGICIENLPPYRPELKSCVEKFFDCIQNCFKTHLKGRGIIESDFQERGAEDYRKQAHLTLRQFETILLHCILYYNNQRVVDFPFTESMIAKGIKPFASAIWNWGIRQEGANLIDVDKKKLILTLLPRTTGRFTRRGLMVNKLRYRADGFKDEFLDGGVGTVAYNPDCVNTVWLLDNGNYIPFELIEARFKDKSFVGAGTIHQETKRILREQEESQLLAKVQLAEKIQTVVSLSGAGTSASVKGIRNTRKLEQQKSHRNIMEGV